MAFFEFDDNEKSNLIELVEKYERSVKDKNNIFFDLDDYEAIIEYYEDKNDCENALIVTEKSLEQHLFSSTLLLKKAQLLFDLKLCDEALEIIENVEILDASELESKLLKAEIFAYQQKYKEAIDILEIQLQMPQHSDEDVIDIYLTMTDIYEDWEKYDEATIILMACLRMDNENEEALGRLNYCIEITEDFDTGIKFHLELIEKNPYNHFAWYNLANAYEGKKEYEKAIDALEFVEAIDEEGDYVMFEIAELYFKLKNYTKAIKILKDIEKNNESDDESYYLQGQCHEALNDLKLARYYYKKASHENPSFSEAFFRIGETYKKEGLWQQAFKAFQKANDLDKEQYDFCLAIAEAAQEIGEVHVAIDACETAINFFSNRYEAYFLLAQTFLIAEDTDASFNVLDEGLENCKNCTVLQFARCALMFYCNQNNGAKAQLHYLLDQFPDDIFLLYDFIEELEDNKHIQMVLAER